MAADDYKHLPRRGHRGGRIRSFLFGFWFGLCLGLTLAGSLFVYLRTDTRTVAAAAPPESSAPPRPKFDFYRLLPNKKEINISELLNRDEDPAAGAGAGAAADAARTYMVQVGSFNSRSSAETVKAELALLGLRAQIRDVILRGQEIRYRVRLGPYTSIRELKATQKMLQENKFEHIVKRLQSEAE